LKELEGLEKGDERASIFIRDDDILASIPCEKTV